MTQTQFVKDHLRAFVERIERLEDEKQQIAGDIREVYAEAKAQGFDVKALRSIVRLRRIDADQRAEQQAILDTYMHALGMLADTPLGEAALKRATKGMTAAPAPQVDTSDPPFAPPAEMPDLPSVLDRRAAATASS